MIVLDNFVQYSKEHGQDEKLGRKQPIHDVEILYAAEGLTDVVRDDMLRSSPQLVSHPGDASVPVAIFRDTKIVLI